MASVYRSDNSSQRASDAALDEDFELVQEILGDSVDAWRTFVTRYSGLIYDVVRRFLFGADHDEIRSLWVDLLETLYNGELSKYKKCARLSTWLVVFARARTIDHVRKRRGRRREPAGMRQLSDRDRIVMQLFYVEKQSLDIVTQTLLWHKHTVDVPAIIDSIQRIEDTIGPKYLQKLDEEHHTRANRLASARVLRYLIHQQAEYERTSAATKPDALLIEQEINKVTAKMQKLVSTLPADEQRIVKMRFNDNMTAKQISIEMKLDDQRKVYTIIDRILRKLRAGLAAPDTYE